MAVKTFSFRNDPTDETSRPRKYYVCDTTAELPATGLLEGDLAYTKDTDTLHAADSATTWDAITGGGGGGAPTSVDYLVGTASGDLSSEIVVGTSPGGELGGTWASPTVDATHSGSSHASVQAAAEATAASALSTHTSSGVHTAPQPPIIGSTAATAVAGNDSRLTNSRTPTAHATSHQPGGSDAMAVDAVAATGSLRTLGTGATQAAAGNDSRFTDERTPTTHDIITKHSASGLTTGHVLKATGATTFAFGALSGLAPAGGSASQVLKKNSATDYDYSWAADATGSGGGNTLYAPGSLTVADGNFQLHAKRLELSGTQRLTAAGTGRIVNI